VVWSAVGAADAARRRASGHGLAPSRPMRGHSNVQGKRTCGINHRPDSQFLDRLAEVCGIDPSREHGLDVVGTIQAMHDGRMKVFVSLAATWRWPARTPATRSGRCGTAT
jgi:hypothetical protein